eukprot:m51a1_g4942 hypothetical protein (967) ;mRNA; r:304529-311030
MSLTHSNPLRDIGPPWSTDELTAFFYAATKHRGDYQRICDEIAARLAAGGGARSSARASAARELAQRRTPEMVRSLYEIHAKFIGEATGVTQASASLFLAMHEAVVASLRNVWRSPGPAADSDSAGAPSSDGAAPGHAPPSPSAPARPAPSSQPQQHRKPATKHRGDYQRICDEIAARLAAGGGARSSARASAARELAQRRTPEMVRSLYEIHAKFIGEATGVTQASASLFLAMHEAVVASLRNVWRSPGPAADSDSAGAPSSDGAAPGHAPPSPSAPARPAPSSQPQQHRKRPPPPESPSRVKPEEKRQSSGGGGGGGGAPGGGGGGVAPPVAVPPSLASVFPPSSFCTPPQQRSLSRVAALCASLPSPLPSPLAPSSSSSSSSLLLSAAKSESTPTPSRGLLGGAELFYLSPSVLSSACSFFSSPGGPLAAATPPSLHQQHQQHQQQQRRDDGGGARVAEARREAAADARRRLGHLLARRAGARRRAAAAAAAAAVGTAAGAPRGSAARKAPARAGDAARWCAFEFFYSDMDRQYFVERDTFSQRVQEACGLVVDGATLSGRALSPRGLQLERARLHSFRDALRRERAARSELPAAVGDVVDAAHCGTVVRATVSALTADGRFLSLVAPAADGASRSLSFCASDHSIAVVDRGACGLPVRQCSSASPAGGGAAQYAAMAHGPPPEDAEQTIRALALSSRLLEQKRLILAELSAMHTIAADVQARRLPYSDVFRQQYLLVTSKLGAVNQDLAASLQGLRCVASHQPPRRSSSAVAPSPAQQTPQQQQQPSQQHTSPGLPKPSFVQTTPRAQQQQQNNTALLLSPAATVPAPSTSAAASPASPAPTVTPAAAPAAALVVPPAAIMMAVAAASASRELFAVPQQQQLQHHQQQLQLLQPQQQQQRVSPTVQYAQLSAALRESAFGLITQLTANQHLSDRAFIVCGWGLARGAEELGGDTGVHKGTIT